VRSQRNFIAQETAAAGPIISNKVHAKSQLRSGLMRANHYYLPPANVTALLASSERNRAVG
jgi:hypothetical protein